MIIYIYISIYSTYHDISKCTLYSNWLNYSDVGCHLFQAPKAESSGPFILPFLWKALATA